MKKPNGTTMVAAGLSQTVNAAEPAAAACVTVDPATEVGPVKLMNAVNNGPVAARSDQSRGNFSDFKALRVPFARTHDSINQATSNGHTVDISAVFPDFEADENDPASYDFAYTDAFLEAIIAAGTKPFFRLGQTIENGIKKYHVFPPKDFAKWARICEHVVAHYNEGWANGFHFGITYWEIWNEADDSVVPEKSFMWCGSFADYCRLYEVAAKHLKSRFPSIKVGGPASCGFYVATPGKPLCVDPGVPDDDRGRNFINCTHQFLNHVRDTESPLDFFSFHSYAMPDAMLRQTECIALELERRKLKGVELILDEWLPNPSLTRVHTPAQNADIAAAIVGGQHSALDMLMLYDARCAARNSYAPLFDPMTARPAGAYWALFYFGELYRRGQEVFSSVAGDGLCVVAATDGSDGALMLVNNGNEPRNIDFETNGAAFRFGAVTDEDRINELLTVRPSTIQPHAFMLLVFDKVR